MLKTILTVLAGIMTLLLYFFNPKAVKKRKTDKIKKQLEDVESKMTKAQQTHNEKLYRELYSKRQILLDELASL